MTDASAAAAVSSHGRRAPLLLVVVAGLVALGALLPIAYLTTRALSADAGARALAPLSATVELAWDTALLALASSSRRSSSACRWPGSSSAPISPGGGSGASRHRCRSSSPASWRRSPYSARSLHGGSLQEALEPLGVDRLPEVTGYWGALVALTLSTYPYVYLLAAAGLRGADASAEEAARSLGAGRALVFARVTLPALRPSLAAASLLVALYVLSDFGVVSLMGYSTLTTGIYVRYESLLALESAAILALVLLVLALAIVLVASRFRLRGAVHRSTPGAGRAGTIVQLGRWRWPALAFCTAVIGLFLAVPVGVLAWWSITADPISGRAGVDWSAALGSASMATATALVAAVVVLPAAVLAWRYPSAPSRWLERLTLLPSALPGIAVALALVFVGARIGAPVYQSLALLLGAYVIRFMPYALASTRASLDSVSPRLEEAARSLGRRPVGALTAVVLPLARSGVLAGAALVFLSTIKELPATLLLKPIGFETLATEIWKGTSIGAYSEVAPSALLLIAIAAPLVYLLSWRNAWELGAAE